jgi:hypothetical protein
MVGTHGDSARIAVAPPPPTLFAQGFDSKGFALWNDAVT